MLVAPSSFVPAARRSSAALAAIAILALAIDRAVALPLAEEAASATTPAHLVVSEVMTGGASASDEFIELYNPTSAAQPLEGLEVVYVTSTGATVTRKAAWAAGAPAMPSGAHLLVANSAGIFAGIADVAYANGLSASGGSVALRVVGAATAIDAVGWGNSNSTWLETQPAPAPAGGSSLERLPGGSSGSGQDSDDNLVDFTIQPVPDPQNSGSPPIMSATPNPTPSGSATPTAAGTAGPGPSDEPTPTATPSATPIDMPTPLPTPPSTPGATPSPAPTSTPIPTPSPVSIAQARALADGSAVTLEGVALTVGDFTEGGGYLVDGSAGIAVLLSEGSFTRGQLLRVAGTVDDRYAQRTVRSSAAQITVLGMGTEPLPVDADTGSVGEGFEGQLVELTGLIASAATTLTTGMAWDLDDGSGPVRVLIDAATGIDTSGWGRGVGLTLIGVVGQRDSSGSGVAGFRVQPRDPADILVFEPAATPTPSPSPTPAPVSTATATPPISGSPAASASASATSALVPLLSIGEARSAPTGTHLRIRGVVTAQSGLLEVGSAVVQDSTGAILVRLGSKAGGLSLGQLVELDGTRSTKAGMLSLRVTALPLGLGTQADPAAIRRASGALGESEEARVVITRGKVSTTVSRPRGGAVSFSIDDGSGPIRVTIASPAGIATGAIERGAWLELRGVLGQETTGKEPLRGYRLWPRMRADVVVIAAPVAGSRVTNPCCAPHGPAAGPRGGAQLDAADQPAAAQRAPLHPPSVARPHPTVAPAPPLTAQAGTATKHRLPKEAGLIVSGMGLAALAGLVAWLGRRQRGISPDTAEPVPAVLDAGPESPGPHLSLLRLDTKGPQEERRILPPT